MPEIKNTFTQGKMNKDLDERIVPNGQYRDAMNIQVSTSEGADVGTVQNILGNTDIDLSNTVFSISDGYECVGSITDEKNDAIYSFITNDTSSAIIEYKKKSDGTIDITPVLVDLNNGVLKFSAGDIITGINIINEFLLWTDGVNEPKKINIISFKKNNHTDLTTHSKLFVNGSNTTVNVTEDHITVIKKKPLKTLSVQINPAEPDNKNPLFKKIFPRFSYRYRYDDGEYSAFAPFTDVVFNSQYPTNHDNELHDSKSAYAEKEPYNSGMINMIDSIELSDFVSPNIPLDVVQIDLLYKQENSSVVYIMEVINKNDTSSFSWLLSGLNSASSYKGNFTVTSENIYAAVPSNQLLRSWDNVPRTALAQEITGNRIVYGNYKQNQTDVTFFPRITSNYKIRNTKESSISSQFLYGNLITNYNFLTTYLPWELQTGITWNGGGWIDFGTPDSPGSPVAQYEKMIYNNDGWGAVGTTYKVSFEVKNWQQGNIGFRLTNGISPVSSGGTTGGGSSVPGDFIASGTIDLISMTLGAGGTHNYEETFIMQAGTSGTNLAHNGRFWIQSASDIEHAVGGSVWDNVNQGAISSTEWGYAIWGSTGGSVSEVGNQLVITQGSASDWITLDQIADNLIGINSVTLSANVISAGGTIRVGLGDDPTYGGAGGGNNQTPNLDMGSGGVSIEGVNYMEWNAGGQVDGIQTLTIDTSNVSSCFIQIMEGSGAGLSSTIDDVSAVSGGFEGSIDNIEVVQTSASTDSNITYDNGGLPSVKSQRNYQLGVVYGDKYGRETPVFTSAESSLVIPFRDFNQSLPSASYPLQLNATINSIHPDWADYYKFFVKETSGEYYNLVMDSLHTPTKEELDSDDHIWLSFASSDRNKISKDDYIILKRKTNSDTQILEDNKFRVLDVQNEAPDAIQYKYIPFGNVGRDYFPDTFTNQSSTPGSTTGTFNANPVTGTTGVFRWTATHFPGRKSNRSRNFIMASWPWRTFGGENLLAGSFKNGIMKKDMYFSFYRTNSAFSRQHSKKYKIVGVSSSEHEGAGAIGTATGYYRIQIDKKISEIDDAIIRISTDSTNVDYDRVHNDVTVRIEQKVKKSPEVFSGRFFVKILANNLIKTKLKFVEGAGMLINHVVEASQNVYWLADELNSATPFGAAIADNVWTGNPSAGNPPGSDPYYGGLVNNDFNGTYPSSPNRTRDIAGNASGTTVSNTAWSNILAAINAGGSTSFFIDNMFVSSAQHGQYARESGIAFNGGIANTIEDTMYHCAVGQVPAGRDYFVASNSQVISWPGDQTASPYDLPGNSIKYTHPTTNSDAPAVPFVSGTTNTYTVNGLDGIATTTSDHTDANGIRRWKTSLFDDTLGNEYGQENGKFYLHLSFLAPGADLHNGNFSSTNDLNINTIHNELQGIHGGGTFRGHPGWSMGTPGGGSTSIYFDNSNYTTPSGFSDDPVVLMERVDPNAVGVKYIHSTDASGNSCTIPLGGYDTNYDELHEKQWDPTYPSDPGGVKHDFIENLKQGRKFRFNGDSSGLMYTIKSVRTKKVYNHSDWNIQWETKPGTSQDLLRISGRSVEQVVAAYADTVGTTGDNGNAYLLGKLQSRLVAFGKASNRRLIYILELETNPTASSTFNPTGASGNINAVSYDAIEFITEDPDLNAGVVSQNPAIWETEPADNVDLDIYYEASQAYPIKIDANTNELFAQIGCRVEFPDILSARQGNLNIFQDVKIVSFDGNDPLKFTLSPGFNYYKDDLGNLVDYANAKIRFFREDGSYTTMKLDPTMETVGGTPQYRSIFKFMPQATLADLTNMETGLSWYNCLEFGNGVESNRIRDDFNAMTIANGVRASATLDRPYIEEHRKSGMIYSGIYNSTSGINNLNQFIMAEKITKDLNPTYGSIQKLFSRRISLIAFCEDRVVGITANKNALYNADGKPQLVATNAVLGDANPFVGDYGISKNPESFAKDSYRAYFTDKQRGAVLRLSMDGLTPISDAGMSQWFKDEFKNPDYNFIGSFDTYKNDYNLTIDDSSQAYPGSKTITYSEDVKGWVSFKSFIQESGVSMAGDYYTFRTGKCYKHDNAARNTFYNESMVPSTVKFLFNDSPAVVKNFNTLNYDGDENWKCESITTDLQSGTVTEFIEKEGKWFNYIKGDDSVGIALDTSAFNFQGIGIASNIIYTP